MVMVMAPVKHPVGKASKPDGETPAEEAEAQATS
jgi:hypothetical protein